MKKILSDPRLAYCAAFYAISALLFHFTQKYIEKYSSLQNPPTLLIDSLRVADSILTIGAVLVFFYIIFDIVVPVFKPKQDVKVS